MRKVLDLDTLDTYSFLEHGKVAAANCNVSCFQAMHRYRDR